MAWNCRIIVFVENISHRPPSKWSSRPQSNLFIRKRFAKRNTPHNQKHALLKCIQFLNRSNLLLTPPPLYQPVLWKDGVVRGVRADILSNAPLPLCSWRGRRLKPRQTRDQNGRLKHFGYLLYPLRSTHFAEA